MDKGTVAEPLATFVYVGGTFNPLHNGHVRILIAAAEAFAAKTAYFVPCHIPPHKPEPAISAQQRLAQLEYWLDTNRDCLNTTSIAIECFELTQSQASYTLHSLQYLRQQRGEHCSLVWVIGMDSLLQLSRWHQWRSLLDYAHIAVVARPGFELKLDSELDEWWQAHKASTERIRATPSGHCALIDSVELSISSTQVRQCYQTRKTAAGLVPECIDTYIKKAGWYTNP